MMADPQITAWLEEVAARAPIDADHALERIRRGRPRTGRRLATAAVIVILVAVGIAIAWQRAANDSGFVSPRPQPQGMIAFGRYDPEVAGSRLFSYDLRSGAERPLSSDPAGVTAAAWSIDGRRLAMTVEQDGGARYAVVVAQADGSRPYEVLSRPKAEGTLGPDFISIDWSPDGALLAYSGRTEGRGRTVSIVGLDGTVFRVFDGHWESVSWSPDGMRLLLLGWPDDSLEGRFDLYTLRTGATGLVRLTDDAAVERNPSWSPDGKRIVFARDGATGGRAQGDGAPGGEANSDIYVMNADGTDVQRLTDSPGLDGVPVWSPDGAWLAFASDRLASAQQQQAHRDGASWDRVSIFAMRPDGSDTSLLYEADAGAVFPLSWTTGP